MQFCATTRFAVLIEGEEITASQSALEIDDALVHKVAIAGTPAQVAEGIRAFFDTGLKAAIIWKIIGLERRVA